MLIPRNISSIEKITSKENSRFGIEGVLVERGEDGTARAVATDNRRLLVVEWREDDPKDFPPVEGFDIKRKRGFSAILPKGTLGSAVKGMKRRRSPKPILDNIAINEHGTKGELVVSTTDGIKAQRNAVQLGEAAFPRWQDVIPAYKLLPKKQRSASKSIRIGFDAKLLAELLTAVVQINKDAECGDYVVLEVPLSPNKPMVIHADQPEVGKVMAVIMPVASDLPCTTE